jgi:P27 family predicted phage terminase small subunit
VSRPPIDEETARLTMLPSKAERLSRAAIKPEFAGGRPKMPDGLPEDSQRLWKQIVKQLSRRRTVTPGDAQVITLYVRTHSHWMRACDYVDAHGIMVTEQRSTAGGTLYSIDILNPALSIAASLNARLESLLKEMGLTGAAREKVKPATKIQTRADGKVWNKWMKSYVDLSMKDFGRPGTDNAV